MWRKKTCGGFANKIKTSPETNNKVSQYAIKKGNVSIAVAGIREMEMSKSLLRGITHKSFPRIYKCCEEISCFREWERFPFRGLFYRHKKCNMEKGQVQLRPKRFLFVFSGNLVKGVAPAAKTLWANKQPLLEQKLNTIAKPGKCRRQVAEQQGLECNASPNLSNFWLDSTTLSDKTKTANSSLHH